MIKIIYFVHGTTYDKAEGKCSGWKQAELTELGKERAKNLGILRKDTHFDVIFTSDLVRAIESANLAFPNIKRIQELTKNISWEEANKNDWRKTKNWQSGWEYIIK